jgi:hypothetical protein
MKRYCLNTRAKSQAIEVIVNIFLILIDASFIIFLCAFPAICTLLILLEPAYHWNTTTFTGVVIALAWLSLGIQQLGKWFITNLEEC